MASGTSYNGWPANSDKAAIGVEPFGDAVGLPFPGGVKGGDVTTVMAYVATEFHYRVEAVVEGWDWAYTWKTNANNPSQLSCHASGTALDINAPLHPNGSGGTFTDAQVGEIYAILNEVQGAVDWLEGYDEMHFEIAVSASTLARIAASLPAITDPDDGNLTMAEIDDIYSRLDSLDRRVTECQERLRGADTGAGQRHEHFDMLQGIDGDTHDTQGRVRGPGDRDWDQLQDIQSTVNQILQRLPA